MQEENLTARKNSIVFAILTLLLHIIACFMFGFFFRLRAQDTQGTFAPLFMAFSHAMLVVIGTQPLTQDLVCCSPIWGRWYGRGWASTSSSLLSPSSYILCSIVSGQRPPSTIKQMIFWSSKTQIKLMICSSLTSLREKSTWRPWLEVSVAPSRWWLPTHQSLEGQAISKPWLLACLAQLATS